MKATKAVDLERMRAVIGIGKEELAARSTLEWLEELRGRVELPRRLPAATFLPGVGVRGDAQEPSDGEAQF